ANGLNRAFPAIPRADTAPTPKLLSHTRLVHGNKALTLYIIAIARAPDKVAHTSPTTSLKTEDTLGAFLTNHSDSLAPGTFLDAMDIIAFSSAAVAASPMPSVRMPRAITSRNRGMLR